MNAGPTGFAHAPVTKGLILASVGSTVVSNAARTSHLPRRLQAFAFKSPGELLFGCLLLYYGRVFERQAGSTKWASYAAVVTGLSYALQLGLERLLGLGSAPLPPLPLPLVLASYVPFVLDIPATSHFSILGGYSLSDKVFVYLAGAQLLLISGRRSLVVLAASTLAGLLYRANFCQVRRLRLPGPLVQLASKLLGPLLSGDQPGPSVVLTAAAGGPGGGAAAGYGGMGGGLAGAGRNAAVPGLRQRGAPSAAAAAAAAGGGGGRAAAPLPPPPAEAVDTLVTMGFPQHQAVQALQQCGNDVEAAVALLLAQHT